MYTSQGAINVTVDERLFWMNKYGCIFTQDDENGYWLGVIPGMPKARPATLDEQYAVEYLVSARGGTSRLQGFQNSMIGERIWNFSQYDVNRSINVERNHSRVQK